MQQTLASTATMMPSTDLIQLVNLPSLLGCDRTDEPHGPVLSVVRLPVGLYECRLYADSGPREIATAAIAAPCCQRQHSARELSTDTLFE